MIFNQEHAHAFAAAIAKAKNYLGSTSPNPAVGAAALDNSGKILSVQAHQKAGQPHAEALVIQELRASNKLDKVHTLIVTLEPCNHHGRTPACSEAILGTPIKRVIIGTEDPNPRVVGKGADRLRAAGIEVEWLHQFSSSPEALELSEECSKLIESFAYWSLYQRPWVIVKTAYDRNGSMIPPAGQKTFTSPESLKLAHLIRKQSDAILTGIETVLADQPEFTVRHLPDHPEKSRWIVVMDRQGRLPPEWKKQREEQGFQVVTSENYESALDFLGKQGVLQVLVEAGPRLSQYILSSGFWNRHVVIRQSPSDNEADLIEWKEQSR